MKALRFAALVATAAIGSSAISAHDAGASQLPPGATYGATSESARMTPALHALMLAQLHDKIKHVFVIFQENHSFDNYFGTYPGAENLGTPLAQSHGFTQYDPIGKRQQSVFKITDPDVLGIDQDRYDLEKKFAGDKMNQFIAVDEASAARWYHAKPSEAQQYGLTTMAVFDCDTVPYLWMYAKNFTLFDHYFQAITGPSTPGNVSMFAAQAGISQEHRFPNEATTDAEGPGVPINGDLDPFAGPYTGLEAHVQFPQSYATLAMTLSGSDAAKQAEAQPGSVMNDLNAIVAMNAPAIPWQWAQEGYVDTRGPAFADKGYVAHHNAPQYFDYVRNNDAYWSHVTTSETALSGIQSGTLPDSGVFFIKGSKINHFGWKPANPDATIQAKYLGDDDHPGSGNSDHQIAEAFVATYVNAIAHSKYWKDSAIIIAWDDGGGFFDHVPPATFEQCNDGFPCGDGQRLPFLLISPYSLTGQVVKDYSDTASVSKFVESVFHVPAMASLPDEAIVAPFGPRDDVPALSDLAGAFDEDKLTGVRPPNDPATAEISDAGAIPPKMNCNTLGIRPLAIPTQPPYYRPNDPAPDVTRLEERHITIDD